MIDGGPAFPSSIGNGMSLRDYFAAQAMAALASQLLDKAFVNALVSLSAETNSTHEEAIAHMSYELADAMLAERSK